MKDYLQDVIKNAYRKLKSYAYFDKTQAHLRHAISTFEATRDLETAFDNLIDILLKRETLPDARGFAILLDSIDVLVFPKKFKEDNSEHKQIIGKFLGGAKELESDNFQTFFDGPIELHLIGMLWTMTIGTLLDQDLEEYVYGNRVRESMRTIKQSVGTSPYLMRPYFEQYQQWRDNPIQKILETGNEDHDYLLINTDLKRYYYNVDLKYDAYNALLKPHLATLVEFFEKRIEKRDTKHPFIKVFFENLHSMVYEIMKTYTKKYFDLDIDDVNDLSGVLLPLGFMPSVILSNTYLEPFDTKATASKPFFYGRYVDDIVLVYRISDIHQLIEKNDLDIILNSDKYIDSHDDSVKSKLLKAYTKVLDKAFCSKGFNFDKSDYEMFTFQEHSKSQNILFNAKKTKMLLLQKQASMKMLENFQKHVHKNRSEFRFIPDDPFDFDYSALFDNQKNPAQKLFLYEGQSFDRYEWSKFIGRQLMLVKHVKQDSLYLEELLDNITDKDLLEAYTSWESLFTLMVQSNAFALLSETIKRIDKLIKLLVKEVKKSTEHEKAEQKECNLKKTLSHQLIYTLSRALSTLGNIDKPFVEAKLQASIKNAQIMQEAFCQIPQYLASNMTNKNMIGTLPYLIKENEATSSDSASSKEPPKHSPKPIYAFNDLLTQLNYDELELLFDEQGMAFNPKYYLLPYNANLMDVMKLKMFVGLRSTDNIEFLTKPLSLKDWAMINGHCHFKGTNDYDAVIRIKSSSDDIKKESSYHAPHKTFVDFTQENHKDALFVSIANVHLDQAHYYFDRVRRQKPNKSQQRFNQLKDTLNDTIRFKKYGKSVDLLVYPECHLNIDHLPALVNTVKKNGFTIVTGVEHIYSPYTKNYYNFTLTLIPFKIDEFTLVYPHLHLKVNYAPEEHKQFNHHVQEGDRFTLFTWRGLKFAPYCCYELTSIKHRSLFAEDGIEALIAVVYNHDVNYFSNIIESVTRDLSTFVIQANDAQIGDSRICQPTKSLHKDVLKIKGGLNSTVLIEELNIEELRQHLSREILVQKDDKKWKAASIDYHKYGL